jgi:hypothetical protein
VGGGAREPAVGRREGKRRRNLPVAGEGVGRLEGKAMRVMEERARGRWTTGQQGRGRGKHQGEGQIRRGKGLEGQQHW